MQIGVSYLRVQNILEGMAEDMIKDRVKKTRQRFVRTTRSYIARSFYWVLCGISLRGRRDIVGCVLCTSLFSTVNVQHSLTCQPSRLMI